MGWVTVVVIRCVRLRLVEFLQLGGAGWVLITGRVHVDAVLVCFLINELLCYSVWVFLAFQTELYELTSTYRNPFFLISNFKSV